MTAPEFLDSDEATFSSSLHDRLQSETPDLERILSGATRSGRRRRMHRRVGVGLASAACIGLAATAYAVIPGAGSDSPEEQTQVATGVDNGTSVEHVGAVTVLRQARKPVAVLGGNNQQQVQALIQLDQLPKTKAYTFQKDPDRVAELQQLFPEIDNWNGAFVVAVVDQSDTSQTRGLRDKAPVALELNGWECEYFPVDDKAWCPGPGDAPGNYVIRPATDRDAFLGKSGGTDSTIAMLGGEGIIATDGTIIGPVRNGIFITVQSGMGFTPELMADFAQALTWTK